MHNYIGGYIMYYYAIIGDIKESKHIEQRYELQEKLKNILNDINKNYNDGIAARFLITLGDEFQGLMENPKCILEIIKYIQRRMYPVELRFGIGIGEIYTKINREAALGADGPAFYAAREAIEFLHKQEKQIKKQANDIQFSLYKESSFEVTEINAMLSLIKVIEDNWSEKQRYTIWDMMTNHGNQQMCAKRMQTTQSTIARRLADGKYIIYEKSLKVIGEAINKLGETYDK